MKNETASSILVHISDTVVNNLGFSVRKWLESNFHVQLKCIKRAPFYHLLHFGKTGRLPLLSRLEEFVHRHKNANANSINIYKQKHTFLAALNSNMKVVESLSNNTNISIQT